MSVGGGSSGSSAPPPQPPRQPGNAGGAAPSSAFPVNTGSAYAAAAGGGSSGADEAAPVQYKPDGSVVLASKPIKLVKPAHLLPKTYGEKPYGPLGHGKARRWQPARSLQPACKSAQTGRTDAWAPVNPLVGLQRSSQNEAAVTMLPCQLRALSLWHSGITRPVPCPANS